MTKGDHIYINCGAFTHHGIDCGDGTVIHYTNTEEYELLCKLLIER
jgi:hypothetical protein